MLDLNIYPSGVTVLTVPKEFSETPDEHHHGNDKIIQLLYNNEG